MLIQQKEISELINCSYHNWYENFKKNCIKSFCLQVPTDVLNYLKQDLFILPKECNLINACSSNTKTVGETTNFDEHDDTEQNAPEFKDFSAKIEEIIKKLGGSAFIKTNWHAPKDSIWITACQSLRVKDLCDVYQLLKASSICKEDLNQIQQDDFHHIIFKKWHDIHPGTEFRCFVRNRNLIGISPRDWPQYHEHFKTQKRDIIKDIVSLFKEKIKDKFPIDNYCFDVIRETKDYVLLVDFSPFNEKYTTALAFDWEFLWGDEIITPNDEDCDNPEFRYLDNEIGIQPNPRNNYGFPQEMIEMFKNSNIPDEQLEELSRMSIEQTESERDSQN